MDIKILEQHRSIKNTFALKGLFCCRNSLALKGSVAFNFSILFGFGLILFSAASRSWKLITLICSGVVMSKVRWPPRNGGGRGLAAVYYMARVVGSVVCVESGPVPVVVSSGAS